MMTNKPTMGKEIVRVFRRPIEIEQVTRAVSSLRLDPQNPRIRHHQSMLENGVPTLTEDQIEEILWKNEAVKRLYQAIIASRGLSEALYIMDNGRTVEGNERLVALRKLQKNLEAGNFTGKEAEDLSYVVENIPCKILPSDITQGEIDVLLARMHVSGKDEWPALNQAAHLHKMHHEDGLTVEDIAQILGKSPPWVYQKLQAYEWTQKYLERYGKDRITDYSFFEELYKIRNKLKEAGLDTDTSDGIRTYQDFVASKVFSMAIDVRKLPKLLKNEDTRQYILGGHGRKAMEMLSQVEPSEFSPRFAALERAKEQLTKMTREDLQMIRDNPAYSRLLADVSAEINDILAEVRSGG